MTTTEKLNLMKQVEQKNEQRIAEYEARERWARAIVASLNEDQKRGLLEFLRELEKEG